MNNLRDKLHPTSVHMKRSKAQVFSFYHEASTPVHRFDTRLKLVLLFLFSCSIFFVQTWFGILIFSAVLLVLILLAGMPVSLITRSMKPLAVILSFMIISRSLSFDAPLSFGQIFAFGGSLPDGFLQRFGIDVSGFLSGLFFLIRIANLVAASLLLCYTSSHNQLIEALQAILYLFRPCKLPLDDIVNLLVMTLRFIPSCFIELDRVLMAQRARGAHFDTGGLLSRMHAWKSVFIPLMIKIFKRSDEAARTMDSRCYTAEGRTVLSARKLSYYERMICLVLSLSFLLIGWYA